MLTYRIHTETTTSSSSIRHLSTAQKNSTMHTFGYVFVYATQSAIYRLKITTSVQPNWKRAWTEKKETNSLSLPLVRTYMLMDTHTFTLTYVEEREWDRERRCWKNTEIDACDDDLKQKQKSKNRIELVFTICELSTTDCCCCCLHTHKFAAYVPALHCSNRSYIFVARSPSALVAARALC